MDNELIPIERRLSAERTTKVFMMRRSEANIRANITDKMEDAWVEIERAFKLIAGGQGYGSNDLNRVRGISQADQEWIADRIKEYGSWARACPDKCRGVVIDMTVFGFSPDEIAYQRMIDKKTVMARFREGLNVWCVMRGWGDQINVR